MDITDCNDTHKIAYNIIYSTYNIIYSTYNIAYSTYNIVKQHCDPTFDYTASCLQCGHDPSQEIHDPSDH